MHLKGFSTAGTQLCFPITGAVCGGGGSSFSGSAWSWPARPTASCATERPVAAGWTTCRPSASAGSQRHHSPGRSSPWHRFASLHRGPTQRWPGSPSEDVKSAGETSLLDPTFLMFSYIFSRVFPLFSVQSDSFGSMYRFWDLSLKLLLLWNI